MFEGDIFRLLMIVLLMANDGGNDRDTFKRLNEVLIVCLLMGSCNMPNDPCGCRRDNCGCGDGCRCGDRRTTF